MIGVYPQGNMKWDLVIKNKPTTRTPPIFRIILLIAIIAFLHFFFVNRKIRETPAKTGTAG